MEVGLEDRRVRLWKRLFSRSEVSGATVDHTRAWVVPAPSMPIRIARAFRTLLSERGVVALEGVSIHPEVKQTLQPYTVSPAIEIRPGTLWPTSEWLYIQATDGALGTLEDLVNTCAGPEICNHLYVVDEGTLLVEWHDAFSDPLYVTGTVSAEVVSAFCAALDVGPPKPPSRSVT